MNKKHTFYRLLNADGKNAGLTDIIGYYSPLAVFKDSESKKIVLCFADLAERCPKLRFAKVDAKSFYKIISERDRELIWLYAKNKKVNCKKNIIPDKQKTLQVEFIYSKYKFI